MSSQPDFTTAETLRLWSQDCDPSMVRSLEQLAEQCEREMAAAANEGTILGPIAKELQDALNWFFPERGDSYVEPETFSVIKALKVITAGLSAKNQALTDRAADVHSAKSTIARVAMELSRLKTGGHAEAPVTIEATPDAVVKAIEAFGTQFDYAMAGIRQMGEENSTLKAQLADARGALDVLHRALHGNLHETTQVVAPS